MAFMTKKQLDSFRLFYDTVHLCGLFILIFYYGVHDQYVKWKRTANGLFIL